MWCKVVKIFCYLSGCKWRFCNALPKLKCTRLLFLLISSYFCCKVLFTGIIINNVIITRSGIDIKFQRTLSLSLPLFSCSFLIELRCTIGDCFNVSSFPTTFNQSLMPVAEDLEGQKICTQTLDEADAKKFKYAINNGYWFQMYLGILSFFLFFLFVIFMWLF